MAKPRSSSRTGNRTPSNNKAKLKKVTGESFYRSKHEAQRKNLIEKQSKAIRNVDGKIIKPALLQSSTASGLTKNGLARIQPDRRWFGNTRVIGVKELEKIRDEASKKLNDPYQVLLHRNRMPLSLIQEQVRLGQSVTSPEVPGSELLKLESFETTFGPKAQRKKPKLVPHTLEDLIGRVQTSAANYDTSCDGDLKRSIAYTLPADCVDSTMDAVFLKGQSKRIWNELYKVIDSSDVLLQILDARNPLGTRCHKVEEYIKKEKPHKHVVFILNKCDLVPAWVTVSLRLIPLEG
jgi:nuclear GTP-binding protein